MNDQTIVTQYFEEHDIACALVLEGEIVYESKARGIFPLYDAIILRKIPLRGAALADRVIGKAAAWFAIEAGITFVHGRVMSEHAITLLEAAGIPYEYEKKTPYIKNRTEDGMCPVETRAIASETFEELLVKVERFLSGINLIPTEYVQRTLAIIKPDAVRSGHIGEILAVYETTGLTVEKMRLLTADADRLDRHYAEHVEKPFYEGLKQFMMSGKAVFMVLSGVHAIERVRRLNGATDPAKSEPGTIRSRFGADIQQNAVHGSEHEAAAQKEITVWFGEQGEE